MTMVRGRPAGPDGASGAFQNDVESERAGWWHALGGAQGVIKGFTHTGVAGQMALDFTPGAALVGERAADGTASLDRGYLVWADSTTRVTFAPASAAARNDAVIVCFADTEDGGLGPGVTQVGPQIIAVTGVSGTTTPRTDAQINAALGRGGWVRLMDVPIASTDTQINVANIAVDLAAQSDVYSYRTQSADVLISNNATWTTITAWAAAAGDESGIAFSSGVWTVKRAGRYAISVCLTFEANATGDRGAAIRKNGVIWRDTLVRAASGQPTRAERVAKGRFAVGDTIDIQGWQSAGGAIIALMATNAVTIERIGN